MKRRLRRRSFEGDEETEDMKRLALLGALTGTVCAALATPLLAASAITPVPAAAAIALPLASIDPVTPKPAQVCLTDLTTFDTQMQKDGYWLNGSGYGYPMMGYGYGYGTGGVSEGGVMGYQSARPGYEVRTLIAAAGILAQQGQQQPCEDTLTTARTVYTAYVAQMKNGGAQAANIPGWQQEQIASAQPVTDANTSFRSDQLLGTDVRNPQNLTLGSVDDLVMSPQTGKIVYLVIARGGIFGFGQKFVPVPWSDFKATPNASLMILDTTGKVMDAAPQVKSGQFAAPVDFAKESSLVDAFWLAHQPTAAAAAPANG